MKFVFPELLVKASHSYILMTVKNNAGLSGKDNVKELYLVVFSLSKTKMMTFL